MWSPGGDCKTGTGNGKAMQKKGLLLLWGWVMVAILAVDYDLGVDAEYLNPWFLMLDLAGETVPGPFIIGQESLGGFAKPLAFIAWAVEGAVVTFLLLVVLRGVSKIVNKA